MSVPPRPPLTPWAHARRAVSGLAVALVAGCAGEPAPPALDPTPDGGTRSGIRVAGDAVASPLFRHLVGRFSALHPGTAVSVEAPLGGPGALSALEAGVLDAALWVGPVGAAPPPRSHAFASTPVVLVAGPGVPTRQLPLRELEQTLRGEALRWTDGGARTFLLRPAGDPAQRLLARISPRLDAALLEAIRSRRFGLFHGAAAHRDALRRTEGSLGVADLGSLRLLALPVWQVRLIDDGGHPRDSLGRLVLWLVLPEAPRHRVEALRDFVTGPDGQALLADLGYLPAPEGAP